jgi:hypothetical protein
MRFETKIKLFFVFVVSIVVALPTLVKSETNYNSFYDAYNAKYYDKLPIVCCPNHAPVGGTHVLGAISPNGTSMDAIGLTWKAVRPSGAVIASGTITAQVSTQLNPECALGLGAIFRLQTNDYYGFNYVGPWATSPVWIKNINNGAHTCFCATPLQIRNSKVEISTYAGNDVVFSTQSGLFIPAKSTVTVKNSNGSNMANVSVSAVYPTQYIDLDVCGQDDALLQSGFCGTSRTTSTNGVAQFCLPNKLLYGHPDGINNVPTFVWTSYYDQGDWPSISLEGGKFVTYSKGFYFESATFPANVADGVSRTITIPAVDSIATVYRLGSLKNGQSVYVANADLTSVISDAVVTDNTGKANFSVPNGTNFRFVVFDTDGTYTYSEALTAPASSTINMVVQNTPTLTAPANNASFTTSSSVNFSWSAVTGAAKYIWYYRHSSASSYSGYLTTTNSFNGVQFSAGTWYWLVQALDSSNNLIAQSTTRSLVVTAATAKATLPKEFQPNDLLASNQVTGHFAKITGDNLVAAKDIPVNEFTEGLLKKESLETSRKYIAAMFQFDKPKINLSKLSANELISSEVKKQFPNLKMLPVKHSHTSKVKYLNR